MTTYVSDEVLASLDHGGSTPPTVSVCSLLSSMGFFFFFPVLGYIWLSQLIMHFAQACCGDLDHLSFV